MGLSSTVLIKTKEDTTIPVDMVLLNNTNALIRALNHKLRLSILKTLAEKPNMSVTAIYVKLRIEQSVASQHLGILRHAGLVTTTIKGHFVYYNINADRIKEILAIVKSLLG